MLFYIFTYNLFYLSTTLLNKNKLFDDILKLYGTMIEVLKGLLYPLFKYKFVV